MKAVLQALSAGGVNPVGPKQLRALNIHLRSYGKPSDEQRIAVVRELFSMPDLQSTKELKARQVYYFFKLLENPQLPDQMRSYVASLYEQEVKS